MNKPFKQIEMWPGRWQPEAFELTPVDQLIRAPETSELTGDLAALELQCGYCLPKEFVFQYETDARGQYTSYQPHRADYYNTRKNLLAMEGISPGARVQDELFSLSQILQEHAGNVAHFSGRHLEGVWPRHLIPIGSDGNGGRLAIEAGHKHFSPVVRLQADPFATITVAGSIGEYLQLQRATFAMEIYIALSMMTSAERQAAVQHLVPDGQYSNVLSGRRGRLGEQLT